MAYFMKEKSRTAPDGASHAGAAAAQEPLDPATNYAQVKLKLNWLPRSPAGVVKKSPKGKKSRKPHKPPKPSKA